jgi:hypothetical protein
MLFFCKEGVFYNRFLMTVQDSFSGPASKLPANRRAKKKGAELKNRLNALTLEKA